MSTTSVVISHKRLRTETSSDDQPRRRPAARKEGAACAECRRLKHKCNRVWPCESCVRRGCAQICPDGALTTGRGNRFILAGSEQLHNKISTLSERIHDLERALEESHSRHSSETHRLLHPDLLEIKAPPERGTGPEGGEATVGTSVEEVDSHGFVNMGSGKVKFLGSHANSWYVLEMEESDSEDGSEVNELPHDIATLGNRFPFAVAPTETTANIREYIHMRLPPRDETTRLTNIYFERATWLHAPVSRMRVGEIVSSIYSDQLGRGFAATPAHELAILLLVLAIGTLMDEEREAPYSSKADDYSMLARAALCLESIFESPTLRSVQALMLMAIYLFYADKAGPGDARWIITGIAVKLAQSLGLHRESTLWKDVEPEQVRERREVFWELFAYDSMQSITFSRPPSFSLAHVDCQMPDEPVKDGEHLEMSFPAWKHRFVRDCLTVMHDECTGKKRQSYETIKKLDQLIKNYRVPPSLRTPGFDVGALSSEGASIALTFQRHVLAGIRDSLRMYLHRGFLARAVQDHPEDPLRSQFGRSVMTALESSGSLIANVRSLYSLYPKLSVRVWFMWSHVFSASILLGHIVIRCPGIPLAKSAFKQLESAVELFVEGYSDLGASKPLTTMKTMREKALQALLGSKEIASDELDRLGGSTRNLTSLKSRSSSGGPRSPSNPPSHSPSATHSPAPNLIPTPPPEQVTTPEMPQPMYNFDFTTPDIIYDQQDMLQLNNMMYNQQPTFNLNFVPSQPQPDFSQPPYDDISQQYNYLQPNQTDYGPANSLPTQLPPQQPGLTNMLPPGSEAEFNYWYMSSF
ncbi:hypothetical protein SISNIDRAFT_453426 [Sistotremastrum niveocremeum HHB9708]|uniref:Zn(2)-C6 fungal-type domain-containing protein n=2 Tax=Sistotremastraceae TaxID=3402574 RepID=A0A164VV83_9AGAM|nr:hypothetical protein SISNIDRAFT_453426 [Sistotremastrum niveocremeum HHB9708]KZT43166.1 hypothetical protein SISSUDRAFT_1040611 [Sistotremastrum suecicum HHB10207 ss-3]